MSDTTDPILIETTGADPMAMARRVSLTRRLLVSAIDRYKAALAFTEEIDEAMPGEFGPPFDEEAEPEDERIGWHRLLKDAEADFFESELGLALRIFNLHDSLAREDRRIGPREVGSPFAERGIEHEGTIYTLIDDPANFDAGTNIIALVPSDRVIRLDD
jgi:hypothetical protein